MFMENDPKRIGEILQNVDEVISAQPDSERARQVQETDAKSEKDGIAAEIEEIKARIASGEATFEDARRLDDIAIDYPDFSERSPLPPEE